MSTVPTNPPANPVPGAVYVDIATNTAYVWTGTGWVPSGGSTGYNTQITTGAAILPGYFAEPDPSSYIAQVGSEPLNPSEGQIWVDDTDPTTPNPAYVWHDGAWVKLTDGSFTDTTVAAVPPASPDTGDTYFETATKRFYVWDGMMWNPVGEGIDTHSIYTMTTPTLRSSGAALQAGDMWVNSVNGNLSYYTGSVWVLMSAGGQATSIVTYATAPAVGAEGDVYYNTTSNTLYASDGTSWVAITGGGSVASALPEAEGIVYGLTPAPAGLNNVILGYNTTTNLSQGQNTIIGTELAANMTNAEGNTLVGDRAGSQISDGDYNTLIGLNSGGGVVTGTGNTGLGQTALYGTATSSYNTAIGFESQANFSGDYNTTLGYRAGTKWGTGSNRNTVIGTWQGATFNAVENDWFTLAKGGNRSNILLRFNENNAWGVSTWSNLDDPIQSNIEQINYGNTGEVLTSQGTGAPPIWSAAAGGGGTDYMGMATEGSPTTRPDGSALQAGDQYQEASLFEKNAASYYWTLAGGGQWKSAHAVIEEGTGIPTITTRTYGDPLIENDFYIDETNANLYRWDGAAWQLLTGATPSGGASDHQQAPVPTSATQLAGFPTTRQDGVSALQTGDTFQSLTSFNGGTYYRSYYYDGTQWMPKGTHNFVDDATPNPAETFAGDTWSQPSLGRFYFAYDTGSGPTWTQIV